MDERTERLVCERCKAGDAVIHLTQFEGGRGVVHHYCVDCARAIGTTVTVVPTSQKSS